jgi:hypothetical protein
MNTKKITTKVKQRKSTKTDNSLERQISSNFTMTLSTKATANPQMAIKFKRMISPMRNKRKKRIMDLTEKRMNSIIKSIKIKEGKENQEVTLAISLEINSTRTDQTTAMEGTNLQGRDIIRNLLKSDIKGNKLRVDKLNFLYL